MLRARAAQIAIGGALGKTSSLSVRAAVAASGRSPTSGTESVAARLLLLAAAAGLAACSSPESPSKDAFATALAPVVRDVYCRPVDVMPYEVEGETASSGLPVVTSPNPNAAGPGSDGAAVKALDALAGVGLVTRTAFEKPARWSGSDAPFVRQALVSYAPTGNGEPYLRLVERKATKGMVSVPSFCSAKGEVVDVVRWSEPSDIGGRRMSQVTYTYHGVDPIPVMPPVERARLAEPKERTAPFELTSDGWRPIAR